MPTPHTDNLLDILLDRVQKTPDAQAFVFLEDGENREAVLTYAELDRRARGIAGELQKRNLQGERALLLYPPGLDFVTAFYACAYAGVIAVPAYPPDPNRLDRTLPRVQSIVDDCSAHCVLTTSNIKAMATFLFPQGNSLSELEWFASDELQQSDPAQWTKPESTADTVVFLQYTSGSTGNPKGVVIHNKSLLANQEMKRLSCDSNEDSVILSWVPFYHDLGLIGGVVHPVYVGATSILMSPMDFLQKPKRWLQAITKYKVTFSAGPNFAFDMCVAKIPEEDREGLDLSSWTMALVGAEPISAKTLKRFTDAFAPHGFSENGFFQGYGLAECVLSASSGAIGVMHNTLQVDAKDLHNNIVTPSEQGDTIEIVSCGRPLTDQEIIVVDKDSLNKLQDMQVGEVWLRGDNVARGYWNRPDATRETFQGYTQDTKEGPYLRTGDLGFLYDGEVYITGRIKELIIIRGQNHYPTDIEQTVSQLEWNHNALRPGNCAAFSTQIDGQDELVIMQEVEPRQNKRDRHRADIDDLSRQGGGHLEIMNAIRESVAKVHGIQAYSIFLLWPGSMPKTSSGKIQRREAKANYESKFLEGTSEVIYGWVRPKKKPDPVPSRPRTAPTKTSTGQGKYSAGEIQKFLVEAIAEKIERPADTVDIDTPFSSFGLDSRDAVGLTGDLQDWIGLKLSATLLFDYPSIRQLTENLIKLSSSDDASSTGDTGEHIIIIGGGVAGITAALELYDLGKRKITILEKDKAPGGKVHSVEVGGQAYEMGQIYFGSNYKYGRRLVERLGIEITSHNEPSIQVNLEDNTHQEVDIDYFGQWTAAALETAGFSLGTELHAVDCPDELKVPFQEWVESKDLGAIPMKLYELWTSYGYGYLTDDMPAYYVIRYLLLVFGMEHFGRIESGNQSLWQHAAKYLGDLSIPCVTDFHVDHVVRSKEGVEVYSQDGRMLNGSQVIFACPPDATLKMIQPTATEREVLESFKTYEYRVAVVRAENMPEASTLVVEENQHAATRGNLLGYFRFHGDKDVFITSQYGSLPSDSETFDSSSLQTTLEDNFKALGGNITETIKEINWSYFPHVNCEDLQSGIFHRLGALQGQNRTLFLGSFTAFETLEHTAASTVKIIHEIFQKETRTKNESIAIVGMACRLPGNIQSPQMLWEALGQEVNGITEIPEERWDRDAYYNPKPQTPGKMCTRWGGFLREIDLFDAGYFGISPREARNMDPQQRLLLETTHAALEDAGIPSSETETSRTGVFMGVCSTEYALRTVFGPDITQIDPYSGTGALASVASGRISYLLNLRGPCLTLDTACSSSLVGVHLACQSLRRGESDIGIAGGVNLLLDPKGTIYFSNAGALSPDGHCKTFDESANGYVRSEGCGVVVLKRLSEAVADNDRIYAVIKGSAVNQDGRTNGLTAPNGHQQQAVVRAALEDARLRPDALGYFEAHGTGTPLGDPIELQSLGAIMAERSDPTRKIPVGAVKSNLGHTEGAAGITGLIKAALVVNKGKIPPNLHFNTPNKNIDWDALPFTIPTEEHDFSDLLGPRTAGVSSFGFSGTNAHAIVQEPPRVQPIHRSRERTHVLIPMSAKTPGSLRTQFEGLLSHLQSHPETDLENLAYTLTFRRTHYIHRAFVVAQSVDEAISQIQSLLQDPEGCAHRISKEIPKIAFLFTGQGSQYVGMGKALYNHSPVFRDIIEKCDEELLPILGQSLVSILSPNKVEDSPIDQTAFTQPVLFAFEYALSELWRSWGVIPDYVMGHSVGEYTAACVAGVFDFRTGLKIIAKRGRLMQSLPTGGKMAAAKTDGGSLQKAIEASEISGVQVAAYNGPKSSVMAGTEEAVAAMCQQLEDKGIATKELVVSHAFHSHLMDSILDPFEEFVQQYSLQRPITPLVSNLSGDLAGSEIMEAEYWRKHIRQPVAFEPSVKKLEELGVTVFCELGPHTQLTGMGRGCVSAGFGTWLPSLNRKQDNELTLLTCLGELYKQGIGIDWSGVYDPLTHEVTSLPHYAFERASHWIDLNDTAGGLTMPTKGKADSAILGNEVESMVLGENEFLFSQSARSIREHFENVSNSKVPFHWFLESLMAANRWIGKPGASAESITLDSDALTCDWIQSHLKPEGTNHFTFRVAGKSSEEENATWVTMATAKLGHENPAWMESIDVKALQSECKKNKSLSKFITKARESRSPFGQAGGKVVQTLQVQDEKVLIKLRTSKVSSESPSDFLVPPGVLDAGLMIFTALSADDSKEAWVPRSIGTLFCHPEQEMPLWISATHKGATESGESILADVRFISESGKLLLLLGDVELVAAAREPTIREKIETANQAEREQLVLDFIRGVLAKGLRADPSSLDMREPLTNLGLDSLISIELLNQLETDLKVDININELQEETTGVLLTQNVLLSIFGEETSDTSTKTVKPLVQLQTGKADKTPVFFVHPVGGSVLGYMDLVRALGPDQPFYGLQVPKVAGGDVSYASVDEMATAYLSAIRERQPKGPYILGGWSMGATVAFEIASRLTAAGEQVAALQLIDGLAPGSHDTPDTSTAAILRLFARDIGLNLEQLPEDGFGKCSSEEGLDQIYQLGIAEGLLPAHLKLEDLSLRFEVSQTNFKAMCAYQPKPYPGPVSIYLATTPLEEHVGAPNDMGWGALANTIVNHQTLAGDHFTILHESGVSEIADEIKKSQK